MLCTRKGFDISIGTSPRATFVLVWANSHNIFRKPGFDLINLQKSGGNAKPYQVRQVRDQLKNQNIP